jgi:hypothetical protein
MRNVVILIIVFISTSTAAYSQFYLGKTEVEVRKELKAQGYKPPVKVQESDRTYSLMYEAPTGQCLIGFQKGGISLLFTMIPSSEDLVTSTVQEFNKTFVKISDTSWKAYKNGKVFDVVMKYSAKSDRIDPLIPFSLDDSS